MIYSTGELLLMGVCLAFLAVFVIYKINSWRRMNGIIKDFNPNRFDEDRAIKLLKLRYGKRGK
jgi:hypothetical protein